MLPPRLATIGPVTTLAIASVVALAATGCQSGPTGTTLLMKEQGVIASRRELRIRIHDFAARFAGQVEETAEAILLETDAPEIRRDARGWMAYGIPAAYRAIFRSDPAAALLDTWAYCIQMRHLFETGPGKDTFGRWQERVVATCRRLQGEIEEIAATVVSPDDLGRVRAEVEEWAVVHPIGETTWVRKSAVAELAEVADEANLDTLSAVVSLTETMAALRSQTTEYMVHVPRQARWLVEETAEDHGLVPTLESVQRLSASVERVEELLVQAPDIVDDQLDDAKQWARDERVETLEETKTLLRETIDEARFERQVVAEILEEQIREVLLEVQKQRVETIETLERIATEYLADVPGQAAQVVDHAFWRATQLLLALLVLGGLAAAVAMVWRRSRASSGEAA